MKYQDFETSLKVENLMKLLEEEREDTIHITNDRAKKISQLSSQLFSKMCIDRMKAAREVRDRLAKVKDFHPDTLTQSDALVAIELSQVFQK